MGLKRIAAESTMHRVQWSDGRSTRGVVQVPETSALWRHNAPRERQIKPRSDVAFVNCQTRPRIGIPRAQQRFLLNQSDSEINRFERNQHASRTNRRAFCDVAKDEAAPKRRIFKDVLVASGEKVKHVYAKVTVALISWDFYASSCGNIIPSVAKHISTLITVRDKNYEVHCHITLTGNHVSRCWKKRQNWMVRGVWR